VRIEWSNALGRTLGSGTYLGDGYILTAAHVVEGSNTVTVTANLGKLSGTATVVGHDRFKDIAVVVVTPTWPLRALELRPTSGREVGAEVGELGFPLFAADTPSLSRGIVSRYLRLARGTVIETDAATNPGNSGGPLIDHDGKVIGIIQSAASGREEGLSRALTSDEVLTILDALKRGRKT
jgi:S1-C subfamily serine protease